MKNKIMLGIVFLFIVYLNFFVIADSVPFTNSVSDLSYRFNLDPGSITGSGINFDPAMRDVYFTADNSFLKVNGNKFKDILPESKAGYKPFIRLNKEGGVDAVDFISSGGTYNINGTIFSLPSGGRVIYNYPESGLTFISGKNGGEYTVNGVKMDVSPNENFYLSYEEKGDLLILSPGIKVKSFEREQLIDGENSNIYDQFSLNGRVLLTEKGAFLLNNGVADYNGIKFSVPEDSEGILIARNFADDLTNYDKSWIAYSPTELKIKTTNTGDVNMKFSKDNDLFKLNEDNLGINQEYELSMDVKGGDALDITKIKEASASDAQIKIIHQGSDAGKTIINNGRNIYNFKDGKFKEDVANLNAKNLVSVPLTIESSYLGSEVLISDNTNGFALYDRLTNSVKTTFDKNRLDKDDYYFKSQEGEEFYNWMKKQIVNAGYSEGGTGQLGVGGLPKYDCIGLVRRGLVETYSGTKISDFPPDLRIIDVLKSKKYGWTVSVIEPQSIAGERTVADVKNIPAGSIVFLMHPENGAPFSDPLHAYIPWTNSKGKNLYLKVGHTLVRGTGDKNFINAIPGHVELIPKIIRDEYFGTVRVGEFIPQDDYLVIISPPENVQSYASAGN